MSTTETGPALGGARLRGMGGEQAVNEGFARHAAEMERQRAEATHARSQVAAPIGRPPASTMPKAPAVGSYVFRLERQTWWPAQVLAVLGGGLDCLEVDAIAAGPCANSDLVEHRRCRLRVFLDRAVASQQAGTDVASAT